jgi:hypothetical protein
MARNGIIPNLRLLFWLLVERSLLIIDSLVKEWNLKFAPVSAETEKCFEK